jgi:hypothetical protein
LPLAAVARAGGDAPAEPSNQEAGAEDAPLFSLDVGVDFVTAYWWQGYLYENKGLIAQPYLELGVPLRDADDGGPAVDIYFGWWSSLHSAHTDANVSAYESWYECDLYSGVTLSFEDFYLDFYYGFYLYPNNNEFDTVQELGGLVGWYPDTQTLIGWLLGEPTIGVYIETRRSNVGNVGDRASYAIIDFGPSVEWVPDKVTVSFPVSVGLSIESFYEDESGHDEVVGYASLGVDLEFPLGNRAGADTTFHVGAVGLLLSDNVSEVNGTSDTEGYLYASLNFAF